MSIRSSDTLGNRNTLQLPEFSKKLPGEITLESLYQINDQSIWFLIWILKKERFWKDLTKEVLEIPFTIIRDYWLNGQIHRITTMKNDKYHSIYRSWYETGQLYSEQHWKDGKKDGIHRSWYENGQLCWEQHWKDGKRDGIHRGWYENGQLYWEYRLKDGTQNGIQGVWCENGKLYWEQHWKDGRKINCSKKN